MGPFEFLIHPFCAQDACETFYCPKIISRLILDKSCVLVQPSSLAYQKSCILELSISFDRFFYRAAIFHCLKFVVLAFNNLFMWPILQYVSFFFFSNVSWSFLQSRKKYLLLRKWHWYTFVHWLLKYFNNVYFGNWSIVFIRYFKSMRNEA